MPRCKGIAFGLMIASTLGFILGGDGPFARREQARAAAAIAPPLLRLDVRTTRASYRRGEAIDVELTLRNRGSVAFTLWSPDYWGVSELVVTDTKGVRQQPWGLKVERAKFAPQLTIPAQGTARHVYRGLRWFHCGGAWEHAGAAALPPGDYRVSVSLTNPPRYTCSGQPTPHAATSLAGTVTSKPASFRVLP